MTVLVACGPEAPGPLDAGLDSGLDSGLDAGPPGPIRSALYPEGWTPAHQDEEGRFLHDFSYAGYRYGEPELGRDRPAARFSVVEAGADPSGARDSTAAVQASIDAASVAGGVVFFPAGLYRVDGLLEVRASRVILEGEGSARSRIAFTREEGMSYRSHLLFEGALRSDRELPLVADAASRATSVEVADAADLEVGDELAVGWVITPEFVEAHAMTGTWRAFNDEWQPFFRRTVVAIDRASSPARVELDVPLRSEALARDGASLRRMRGHLFEVGLEGLGVANAIGEDAAWASDQIHAVELRGVIDGWIRDVASFDPADPEGGEGPHLASGGILIRDSKRVTVADSSLARAQNRGPGGNGYLFEVRTSSELLFRDCVGRAGRHNFIQNWGFGATGIVWLRIRSLEGSALTERDGFSVVGLSEFHHSLAMANLIDASRLDDGWAAVNRGDYSSGAGHTATESVFWNVSGEGRVRSFQHGHGYVIGAAPELDVITAGVPWEEAGTAPADWTEALGEGARLEPSSLYEDQRARRLARR